MTLLNLLGDMCNLHRTWRAAASFSFDENARANSTDADLAKVNHGVIVQRLLGPGW